MSSYSDFVGKLDYLQDLYVKANEAIILLENHNASQSVFLGTHNELRSALNHIMWMVKYKDDKAAYEKEFSSAEAHLWRAGYDAYEMTCIEQIAFITEILGGKYSNSDLRMGMPDYYERIRPAVEEIKLKVANVRANKKGGKVDGRDAFEAYFNLVEQLIGYTKEVMVKVPTIDACYAERLRKERRESKRFAWGIVASAIAGYVAGKIDAIIACIRALF
jgi:hypothetical protein